MEGSTAWTRPTRATAFALFAVLAAVVLLSACTSGPENTAKHRTSVLPRFHSLYVPMRDGVRLAVDVWLPAGTTAASKLPTVLEGDRYWRARAYSGGFQNNPEYLLANPWNEHGFAYVFADLRGTGASFGVLKAELGTAMITDVGTLADWIAAQPWSDNRVGTTGVSYGADVAMLALYLRNHHITAAAPLSYDFDPYEDILRPGGVLTEPWLQPYATLLRVLDDAGGTTCSTNAAARRICAEDGFTGASPEPVEGPNGGSLLRAARSQHRGNASLVQFATAGIFRDYSLGPQNWPAISVGGHLPAIKAGAVPILTFAGWLDAGTPQGVLSQFTSLSNTQEDWIGPWSHGESYVADPFKPSQPLPGAEQQQLHNIVYAFFDRYVKEPGRSGGTRVLHYYTLNAGTWHATTRWPVAGTETRALYLASGHGLAGQPAASSTRTSSDLLRLNRTAGTGSLDRWHTNFTGSPVVYPNRATVDRKLLTYTSAPLRGALQVTGNPAVTLQVTGVQGAGDGALYAYLEDVSPNGRVTYITEGDLALIDRAEIPAHDNPAWRKLLVPRTYDRAQASPFPEGKVEPVTFDLLPTSVLFRSGDRIRLAIAAADPSSFQLLPPNGEATYRINHGPKVRSVLQLPVVGACSICGL
jgi:putative CocE/NonD family hydrolase